MPFTPAPPTVEISESSPASSLRDVSRFLSIIVIISNIIILVAALFFSSSRPPVPSPQTRVAEPKSTAVSNFLNDARNVAIPLSDETALGTDRAGSTQEEPQGGRVLSNVRQEVESEQQAQEDAKLAAVTAAGSLILGNKKISLPSATASFSPQQIVLLLKTESKELSETCVSVQLKFDTFRRACDPIAVRNIAITLFPLCSGAEKPIMVARDNAREDTGLSALRCERRAGGVIDYTLNTTIPNGAQTIKLSASGHLILE